MKNSVRNSRADMIWQKKELANWNTEANWEAYSLSNRQKEKRMRINEHSLRDLWDPIKHTKICKMAIQKEMERENGAEGYLKTHHGWKYHKFDFWKKITVHIWEASQIPSRINSKRSILRHSYVIDGSTVKSKRPRVNLKSLEKWLVVSIKWTVNFSSETVEFRISAGEDVEGAERKGLPARILYAINLPLKTKMKWWRWQTTKSKNSSCLETCPIRNPKESLSV